MRIHHVLPLSGALVLALAAPAARADGNPGEAPPKGDAVKDGAKDGGKEGGKDGAKKEDGTAQAEPTRIERARRLVKELETTLTILRAQKADAATIAAMERAITDAKKLAQPLTASELSLEEKMKLGEELRKEAAAAGAKDGPPKENPGEEWKQRAMASAFKDAELSEEEEISASKIIGDWFQKSEAARMSRDSKAMSDLKRERDESLEKSLGRKKAQKVINNLNGMAGWKR